jgi:hypothetical protein
MTNRPQQLVEQALGEGATFRAGQLEAVLALVDDGPRVLAEAGSGPVVRLALGETAKGAQA